MSESVMKILSDEKNLERVLDNLRDGIIAHDMNRRIFFFNREAEKITGYDRREVLGKDCHDLHGGPFCGENCSFCDENEVQPDTNEYSVDILTKSGEARRLEMCLTMIRDERDENVGVLASFRDISDLIELKIRAGESAGFADIIGRDSKMLAIFRQIRDYAPYDYPVHIFGDTGTGKELVARAIHNQSARKNEPFVPINCGALPEGLIESELFGHVRGSFSGAVRDKKGRFELADGGTVFLDEVAELPKHVQAKLLRFLQEGTLEKVGSEKHMTVNARVISATNMDLKKQVKANRFRDDLYYRLNVIPLVIPPLRKRKNDIPLLCEHFLEQAAKTNNEKSVTVSPDAMNILMDYNWPGNVRELQNVVHFSMIKSRAGVIMPADLPAELVGNSANLPKRGPDKKLDVERVRLALKESGGNKAKAARLLGVGRATLYRFLADNPE